MSPQLPLLLSLVPHHSHGATSTVGLFMSFGVLLSLTLASLLWPLCAVVTLLLYRRSPKRWYWLASAIIGGIIAYVLYDDLLGFSGIIQQLAIIFSVVLGALLFAGAITALLLYHNRGMSMMKKGGLAIIGTVVAVLLFLGLLGLGVVVGIAAMREAPELAYTFIIFGLWQHSRTR